METTDLKHLLSKLLEEQDVKKERLDKKMIEEETIGAAAKTAFKANAGTLSTAQNKKNATENPSSVIQQHLLSAYKVIKANPGLKLGPVTSQIKKFFDAEEAKKANVKKPTNASLVTNNADGTKTPVGQVAKQVAPKTNGPAVAPPAVKTESIEEFLL